MSNAKIKVAALSVASNTTLTGLKTVAGLLSGSVSILSEAIHSSMDLIASVIAFFSVRESDKPADRQHPYGHGKIESISGVIEGLLIFLAAAWIIFEAVQKLIHPHEMGDTWFGLAVMTFAALVNAGVSALLYRTAKKEDSLALEADALHLKTDVITSAGVALGLLVLQLTHLEFLDPLIAMAVALLIIKEAWGLVTRAFDPLLDHHLEEAEVETIRSVLQEFRDHFINYHQLRTRKSGRYRFIDFHLTVDGRKSVREVHDLADQIEAEIEKKLHHTNVTIHFEPEGNV